MNPAQNQDRLRAVTERHIVDYTISDMEGFALITQTDTNHTVVAVPLPMGEQYFAFFKLFHTESHTEAVDIVAAMVTAGQTPADYIHTDRDEETDHEGIADRPADLPADGRPEQGPA